MLRLLTAAQARLHAIDREPVLQACERIGRPRDGRGFEGRIEWVREGVDPARLDGLRPGLAWLDERHRRLDREALRYYEALRCIEVLAFRGVHQREGSDIPDAWHGSDGERNLIARVQKLTGPSLEMPC